MSSAIAPFGRVLTAIVTPFTADGALDLESLRSLAIYLADRRHDGLVVNGTTGESATTSDDEKRLILQTVKDAVGDRIKIVAGVGTNDTAHSISLARQAAEIGADGALVVTPYYNKPPQTGILAHFRAVADATDLPVMVYDIPGRAGVPITTETHIALAAHPNIVAVKDAKGDLWAASHVQRATDLAWYSGDDGANLAHFAQGAHGIVGVTSHFASIEYANMIDALNNGNLPQAIDIHRKLIPAVDAIMGTSQGAITVKAALAEAGIIATDHVRLPLAQLTDTQRDIVRQGLKEAHLS
ncbi:Dihydrodipicolinate synthase [Dermatophilus congolensis]|uniref:4-hydroxy-tetrahydrodipicolinate synthase n=1 Tax=Dermatophilus congolensis TaxID=1863 RepID=A0A239VJE4_9MICO|nr:4-hydroxy-tetrahydrodipicolinate synthase [Dermatophilus congolensis]SNV22252.1 Dihydrodipicolinate synthase [Dermatophilus congolensis]